MEPKPKPKRSKRCDKEKQRRKESKAFYALWGNRRPYGLSKEGDQ